MILRASKPNLLGQMRASSISEIRRRPSEVQNAYSDQWDDASSVYLEAFQWGARATEIPPPPQGRKVKRPYGEHIKWSLLSYDDYERGSWHG